MEFRKRALVNPSGALSQWKNIVKSSITITILQHFVKICQFLCATVWFEHNKAVENLITSAFHWASVLMNYYNIFQNEVFFNSFSSTNFLICWYLWLLYVFYYFSKYITNNNYHHRHNDSFCGSVQEQQCNFQQCSLFSFPLYSFNRQ